MPISDEKIEEILDSFKSAVAEMTRVHKENENLHKDMLKLCKENIELKHNGHEQPQQQIWQCVIEVLSRQVFNMSIIQMKRMVTMTWLTLWEIQTQNEWSQNDQQ